MNIVSFNRSVRLHNIFRASSRTTQSLFLLHEHEALVHGSEIPLITSV